MTVWKLFSGRNFYPMGGYEDFIGIFQTEQSAKDYVEKIKDPHIMWAHIVVEDNILVKGRVEYNSDEWVWEVEE